ncbi:MAG TPA: histidinol-phosphate transaminase [Clostridiaceae bacterium]|nr:histidinol-phosphate transaminase [Clostridiaceae bacterium]
MIRINKNESPLSALSEDVLREIVLATDFHRYPAQEHDDFVKAYADFHGLDPKTLGLANGSDEWIQKFMILLGDGPILTLAPDFSMYEGYAKQLGRTLVKVQCDEDYVFDADKVVQALREHRPSFFIFSQPNNPTGTLHSEEFVSKVAEAVEETGGYLVVDEAYMEYAKGSYVRPKGDNVIVIRTLSKIYGLAGLRIGVAIASEKTLAMLNTIAHPYPVNSLSLNIGTYLLNHGDDLRAFFERHHRLSARLKEIFMKNVSDVMKVLPSETNFIFTYGELAPKLGAYIHEKGFLPRTYTDPMLHDVVRYSIAVEEDLDLLEDVVKEWRKSL